MFKRVKLVNYKCFPALDLSFTNRRGTVKPSIIIIGNNGTGKSTLVTSFVVLKNLFDGYHLGKIRLREPERAKLQKIPNLACSKLYELFKPYYQDQDSEILFEFEIEDKDFGYEVKFNSLGHLIYEHLYRLRQKKEVTLFKADAKDIMFHEDFFRKQALALLEKTAQAVWGKFSILGILGDLYYDKSPLFKHNEIHGRVLDALGYFSHLQIVSYDGNYSHIKRLNMLNNTDFHPFYGRLKKQSHEKLYYVLVSPAISEILSWLVPSISQARYEFTLDGEEETYQLYVWQKTSQGEIKLPIQNTSFGIRNITRNIHIMIDSFQGFPAIIDDFDLGLHFFIKKEILERKLLVNQNQYIIVMQSTAAFEHAKSSDIYLSHRCNGDCTIKCIDDILPTQANHNNRIRYEQGTFVQPDYQLDLRIGLLLKEITQNIRKLFYKDEL